MDDLVAAAWHEYQRFANDPCVRPVAASMPILYFGDSRLYLDSTCRVVTVGLNPSLAEFPEHAPTSRFASVTALPTTLASGLTTTDYRYALDAYFRTDPYRWFNCFRSVLRGLHASYDDTQPNRALHTDLCSPLATNPTWSGLSWQAQRKLREGGTDLWHRLVGHFHPHVIIMSVKDEYREAIRFRPLGEWHELTDVSQKKDGGSRKKPYRVLVRAVAVTEQNPALLVYAPAAQTPFGSISLDQQMRIGRMIEEYL